MSEGENPEGSQESVPWSKYVGVKEMLKREEEKVVALQEQIDITQKRIVDLETEVRNLVETKKTLVDPEEFNKTKQELEQTKSLLLQTKKDIIAKDYGINPDELKDLDERQLDVFVKGLKVSGQVGRKPGADLGIGGAATERLTAREMIKRGLEQERK